MADIERQVKIAFQGDDQISKIVDQVNGKLDGFAMSVRGVTTPLSDLAGAVLKTEAAMAALAVGGLVYAASKSIEFEAASIELKKVLGDEVDQLSRAEKAAMDMSEQYGESSKDVLLSTANFKQAGFDIDESLSLAKAAMDLVIAGSLGAGEASEYLVSILKGYKAPASEAARVIDVLNEVSNLYATDVRQLAIGMSDLSPIAKLMGFSFEELAGLLTPVIEVFRDGGESANALKVGLLKLVDDRGPVVEALTAIGVAQKDQNGQMRSGKDILHDVSVAFTSLTDEEKIFFAQQLSGIEQGARMVEVFNGLAKSQEVTAAAMKSAGSAAAEVQARLESGEVAVKQFKVGFENLSIIVGDQFLEAAKEAVKGGTAIEKALQEAVDSGSFKPIFDAINEFGVDLEEVLKKVAKNLPEALAAVDWSGFLDSIESLGSEFADLIKAFFGNVDLTSAEGLRTAIQKIVDIVTALTNVTAGIVESWQPFVKGIAQATDKFLALSPEAQKSSGNVLGFGQAIDKVLAQVDVFTGGVKFLGGAMAFLGVTQIPGAVTALSALVPAMASAGAAVGAFGAVAAALVAGWGIDKILSATLPGWEENRQAIVDNISVMHGAEAGMNSLSESLDDTGENVSAKKDIWQELSDAIDALPETVSTEVEAKGTALTKEEIDEIVKAFDSITEKKEVEVSAIADEGSIEKVKNILITELPDGVIVLTQLSADEESIKQTKKAIAEIPEEKLLKMQLEGEVEKDLLKIKTGAESIQTALEWKAKVDIAEIEAMSKTIMELSDNTVEMFKNSSDLILGLSKALKGVYAPKIYELMLEQVEIQEKLANSQIALNDAQIKLIAARAEALKAGNAMITIEAAGLEPELELVLHKIIELTQIRANEEGLAFLLGI